MSISEERVMNIESKLMELSAKTNSDSVNESVASYLRGKYVLVPMSTVVVAIAFLSAIGLGGAFYVASAVAKEWLGENEANDINAQIKLYKEEAKEKVEAINSLWSELEDGTALARLRDASERNTKNHQKLVEHYRGFASEAMRVFSSRLRVENWVPIDDRDNINNQRYLFKIVGPNGQPNRAYLEVLSLLYHEGSKAKQGETDNMMQLPIPEKQRLPIPDFN